MVSFQHRKTTFTYHFDFFFARRPLRGNAALECLKEDLYVLFHTFMVLFAQKETFTLQMTENVFRSRFLDSPGLDRY